MRRIIMPYRLLKNAYWYCCLAYLLLPIENRTWGKIEKAIWGMN